MAFQENRSLLDGLACLRVLAGSDEPVGCREMARLLGMEPTRAYRLLRTLKLAGLTRQDSRRKYVPGPGIHVLAAQCLHGSSLIRAALPVVREMAHPRWIVALGVLWRDQVSYLYHASPGMGPEDALGRAGLFAASRSSIGRVLLAHRERSYLARFYGSGRIPGYEGDFAAFCGELSRIREAGLSRVAISGEQWTIGVPVSDVAGLAFAGIESGDDGAAAVATLRACAQRIGQRLEDMGQ